jgi:hypothetical protein
VEEPVDEDDFHARRPGGLGPINVVLFIAQ